MLNKIFRPKWQHENPEVRLSAINKLGQGDIAILQQLAAHDSDKNVRKTALAKIDDIHILEKLILQGETPDESFALKCWVHALTDSDKHTPLEQEKIITDCMDQRFLNSIISYCENNNLRHLALAGITGDDKLLMLLEGTKHGGTWQIIIEKLQSEEAIKKANAIINGRDKKSQQLIKARLEHIKKEQESKQQREKLIAQLSGRLNTLLDGEFNPLFEGILLTVKQQFQTIDNEITESQQTQLLSLIERCEKRLKEKQIRQAERLDEQKVSEQQKEELHHLIHDLKQLFTEACTNTLDRTTIEERLLKITDQWQECTSSPANHNTFEKIRNNIRSVISTRKLIEDNNVSTLPSADLSHLGFSETKRLLTSLKDAEKLLKKSNVNNESGISIHINTLVSNLQNHQAELHTQNKQLHKDIEKDLSDTEVLVEQKNLKSARRLLNRIKSAMEKIPEQEGAIYNSNFQRLYQATRELEDWKNYVGDEKRLELCEKMESLTDSDMDMQARADTIKSLQQEWKSLGHCRDQALWGKFRALADTAYAPCQEYFNKQREIRQFNTAQCQSICEQFEQLIQLQEWETTDWKSMDSLYRAIHDEWKKYFPVERHAYKALQDRFHHLARSLKQKLDEERNSNHEKLARLIQKAHELMAEDDTSVAIDTYNHLMQDWKNIGITFHKKQQQQWQQFRQAGDQIYEKRQNQKNEAEHERHENLANANRIIKDIDNLADQEDQILAQNRGQFETLKSAFKSLGSLPKDHFKQCFKEFNTACEKFESNFNGINKRQWIKQLHQLQETAKSWLDTENNGMSDQIAISISTLPEKWHAKLQQRFDDSVQCEQPDTARLICIEMEILAGTETPASDATLKMQWQMENLAKNFGQSGNTTQEEKIENLYLRWYSQPCWNKEEYLSLEKRFLQVGEKLLTT